MPADKVTLEYFVYISAIIGVLLDHHLHKFFHVVSNCIPDRLHEVKVLRVVTDKLWIHSICNKQIKDDTDGPDIDLPVEVFLTKILRSEKEEIYTAKILCTICGARIEKNHLFDL